MFRTSNPVLSNTAFRRVSAELVDDRTMTVQGAVNKTLLLLGLLLVAAAYTWSLFAKSGSPATGMVWVIGGLVVGLIAGLVTSFKPNFAHISAPIYALGQGLFLGGISAVMEAQYPGLVFQAVGLTTFTLFCLLAAYKAKIIQVTQQFRTGLLAATGGVGLFYLVGFILSFFGVRLPIFGSGLFGIGFSLVVVAIAALNLVLDFDFIEQSARSGAPKQMEWYGAFGLLVTLVWLYVEILKLLSKLRERKE